MSRWLTDEGRERLWELVESMALLAGTIAVSLGLGVILRGLLG